MAFKLTPEQQAIYDKMVSFKEKESYLEECQLEAAFYGDPEPSPVSEPAPPVVEPEAVKPEPEKKDEVPEPIAPPIADTDDTDWKQEAEVWKKRKADADRALTPIQQENAKLKKERESQSAELAELKSMLEDRFAELKKQTKPDESPEDDFALTYPDVAERIARAKREMKGEVDKELNERLRKIEEADRRRNESHEAERLEAYRVKHEARVKSKHPDVADYFDPEKKAPALVEWAKTQPPMIGQVLNQPLNYTPEDVIFALDSFKQSLKSPEPKTPTLGDRVQAAKSIPSIATPVEDDLFSEDEMTDKHIETLMRQHRLDPKELDKIEAKYIRTFEHMSKH
jgi:hypothetical protein